MFEIRKPYLLFLGDASDILAAKTAKGILDWRAADCVGQIRLPNCIVDLGLPDLSLEDAYAKGAKTLVVGVAIRGGRISRDWICILTEALKLGYDLAAGLHQKLADVQEISELAVQLGLRLHDVRHSSGPLNVGDGRKRPGKRLLTVGTDCSCGKMYTALAIEAEMKARNMSADFRATGQTGILIAGQGVSVDAVAADFISGTAEALTPHNHDDHWDLVEGQGSLFHPSFAGVSLGLLHGAQPDALILCHEPTRRHMRGLPHYSIPDLKTCIDLNLQAAMLTNPDVQFAGICVNTSALNEDEANKYLNSLKHRFDVPAVDPFRHGVNEIVSAL